MKIGKKYFEVKEILLYLLALLGIVLLVHEAFFKPYWREGDPFTNFTLHSWKIVPDEYSPSLKLSISANDPVFIFLSDPNRNTIDEQFIEWGKLEDGLEVVRLSFGNSTPEGGEYVLTVYKEMELLPNVTAENSFFLPRFYYRQKSFEKKFVFSPAKIEIVSKNFTVAATKTDGNVTGYHIKLGIVARNEGDLPALLELDEVLIDGKSFSGYFGESVPPHATANVTGSVYTWHAERYIAPGNHTISIKVEDSAGHSIASLKEEVEFSSN